MSNFRKILLPTDFSPCANAALYQAITIAERFQGAVTMLHVVTVHESDRGKIESVFSEDSKSYDQIMTSAEEMLHTKEGMIETPVLIEKVLRRGISPTNEIINYAAEHKPDLIVMGTHGRTGIRRLIMGSVAEKIIRLSDCPTMTVRCGSDGKENPYPNYRSILLPVDFSATSVNALWRAAEMARSYGAILTLLHVAEPIDLSGYTNEGDGSEEDFLDSQLDYAEKALHEFTSNAPLEGIQVYTRVVHGRPGRKIIEYADEEGIDLIIIPSLGKSGLERLLMGSTVNKVVHRANCPVMVLKKVGDSPK